MRVMALVAAACFCWSADAVTTQLDRITLTNGRALVGTISAETDDAYTIALVGGGGGAIQVAKSRVVSIERGAELVTVAPTVPVEDQRPIAKPEPAPEVVVKKEQADTVRNLKAEAKKKNVVFTGAMAAYIVKGKPISEALGLVGTPHKTWKNGSEMQIYEWRNQNGSILRVGVLVAGMTVEYATALGGDLVP